LTSRTASAKKGRIITQRRVSDNEVLRPKPVVRTFLFGADSGEDVFMVLIRVQYDGYNKRFTVIDRDLLRSLADGETYMLVADVSTKDLELKSSAEIQPPEEYLLCGMT
jgi:hypothetical protein